MIWTGVIKKGEPEVSFNGSIEEVTRQIRSIDENFAWHHFNRDHQSEGTLNKRDAVGIVCDVQGEANHGPLTPNMEAARGTVADMTGECTVPTGPGVCSLLTCHNHAGVWLCNDNSQPVSRQCSSLALYVDNIIRKCGTGYIHGHRRTRGQEFDSGNWNVIAAWKEDC
ncbi:hypothetical protein GGS20DRAFT_88782 [Poronia punctata]|nr:hypothetical protein GGS20DRAFT_88782 [Poronia punctata]